MKRPQRPIRFSHHFSTLLLSVVAVTALLLVSCSSDRNNRRKEITLFAAASTRDAALEVAKMYQQQTGTAVVCNFASSSILARQIEHGARADIFLSANPQWMDYLQQRRLIRDSTRRDILSNRLVVVAPADYTENKSPAETGNETHAAIPQVGDDPQLNLTQVPGMVALGDPGHVPLGIYSKQALQNLGWWDGLKSRIVTALDARAALRLVEMKETEWGVVYYSDARESASVRIVRFLPDDSHDPIVYPLALCSAADESAIDFYNMLTGEQAGRIFQKRGFLPAARKE